MVEALAPQAPLPVLDSRSVQGPELRLKADVVVVGSGAGGGVVAYELARAGRSVVVVEAGAYVPSSAFTETLESMFDRVYQDAGGQMNTDGDLMVLQGRCVGGSTVVNGAVCFRLPPRVLEKWQKAHGLVDHTAERMSAIYAVMEKRLSVHVNAPHEINANSAVLVRGCEKLGWHHAPLARNVKDCALTGFCFHGCASDRKQSALVTHLPWAVAHGAQIIAETQIDRIRLVDGRAVGVEGTLRRGGGEPVARVVVDAERVVVVEHLAFIEPPAALAVHALAEGGQAFVQRGPDGDNLESRARLVTVHGHAVLERGDGGLARLVRVVGRARTHREDFTGAWAQHDGRSAHGVELGHDFRQLGFEDVLHRGVDREHGVEAVLCYDFLLTIHHQLRALAPELGLAPTAHAVARQLLRVLVPSSS